MMTTLLPSGSRSYNLSQAPNPYAIPQEPFGNTSRDSEAIWNIKSTRLLTGIANGRIQVSGLGIYFKTK